MEVFHSLSINSLIDGYSDIVQYAYRYFDTEHIKLMKLWIKLLIIGKNNENSRDIMLHLGRCLCTPFSNATLL